MLCESLPPSLPKVALSRPPAPLLCLPTSADQLSAIWGSGRALDKRKGPSLRSRAGIQACLSPAACPRMQVFGVCSISWQDKGGGSWEKPGLVERGCRLQPLPLLGE